MTRAFNEFEANVATTTQHSQLISIRSDLADDDPVLEERLRRFIIEVQRAQAIPVPLSQPVSNADTIPMPPQTLIPRPGAI